MFIKTITKDSRTVKRIRNYLSKSNLYVYFLMSQNLLISGEKMLMSAEIKECVTWFIHFLDLPLVRYNCAKFHHCRICVADFRERGPKSPFPPNREQPRKSPSWIGLIEKVNVPVPILEWKVKRKSIWQKHSSSLETYPNLLI